MEINSKLPATGTTVFTVMSRLASEQRAINLGQGFPDYPMDPALVDAVAAAMRDGYNQYAPMEGWFALREAIANKIARLYGTALQPETDITITPGGTYGIYTALTTILRPGDEVILFEPAYDSYVPNVLVNGAVPVLVSLRHPDYRIDWEEVRARIGPRTRAIVINSPHNPTGTTLDEADLLALQKLVAGSRIFVVSDEVYEHLIFDGRPHQSLLRYPALFERSFVCFSFGKLYHCTGWKIGYVVAPAPLMKEFRKLHQFNAFSVHTPMQVALASFLADSATYEGLAASMQARRDHFQSAMAATPFTPLPSRGSYFQLYTYERITGEPAPDFARRLIAERKVAAIPVTAFYQEGHDDRVLRFCFAKKFETLEEAAARLTRW